MRGPPVILSGQNRQIRVYFTAGQCSSPVGSIRIIVMADHISRSLLARIDSWGAFFFYCSPAKMIPRVTLGRNAQCILQWPTRSNNRRCLATAASGSFSYETGDAGGVRFASRDLPGPTTHLAVVAKAGTRYQPLPGFSEGLEKFSFKVCPSFHSQLNCISSTHIDPWMTYGADCLFGLFLEYAEAICSEDHQRD